MLERNSFLPAQKTLALSLEILVSLGEEQRACPRMGALLVR